VITEMQAEFRKQIVNAIRMLVNCKVSIPHETMTGLVDCLFDLLVVSNRMEQPIINLTVKFDGGELETVKHILSGVKKIMSDTTDLLEKLDNINAQIGKIGDGVTKIGGETTQTLAQVAELKAIIDAGGNAIPQEVKDKVALIEAGLNNTRAIVDYVDQLIPDAA
jgi:hypothetical protein